MSQSEGRRGRWTAPIELVGLALGFLVFSRLHAAAGHHPVTATDNALALQSVERFLHIDIELAANRWLTEHPLLIQPAVWYYRGYYLVLAGVLLWVYLRHADSYRKVRRVLVAMVALALAVFWALPMSPPRFALPGIVDIIAEHDSLAGQATRDMANGQNHFSAMPSLHTGWSLWCAYAAWTVLRVSHPRLALLPWLFPLGMAADVLITGNHYVLDVAASVVLLVVCVGVASLWGYLIDRRRGQGSEPSVSTNSARSAA